MMVRFVTPRTTLFFIGEHSATVDPVTYDSFDTKGARSLEAMVQTYLASGSLYLELYVQFSSPNDAFVTSTSTIVLEEYTTPARHSVSG
ncbi:hypothetical protein J1N35_029798 [Gossypium stocksii]|uniref:Uncharacterized protein n=1 Tax=Gossypium stocksii TaxID=47602 RepID=A0A9D3UYL4_9ROSI|nr:hypothetical protein J1N35_029798 [Gossypium stocksii]